MIVCVCGGGTVWVGGGGTGDRTIRGFKKCVCVCVGGGTVWVGGGRRGDRVIEQLGDSRSVCVCGGGERCWRHVGG